jgi:precorrin-6B methylase 2
MLYLPFKPSDAILDYGSGKGGVLAQLSKYPFRRIAGIELSQILVDISKANFKKLGLNHLEIIHSDATTFTEIDDFNYFYFFNPFQGRVFERVFENIIASMDRNPRQVTLIYYHPRCHDLIQKTGRFKLVKVFKDGPRRLNIYFNR